MSKIVSIGTSVPAFRHTQDDILQFMQRVYSLTEQDNRKLRFLYRQSGISHRHSVIPDYSRPIAEWKFYPQTENLEPFPTLEQRMQWYGKYAPSLSVDAVRRCLEHKAETTSITHLITVSCTGMSAPGLDLQLLELLQLPRNTIRTSVNFMGCYAAIHALKLADSICRADPASCVLIVCTELCTLHFQKEHTTDNIASSLLFSDGSAAVLVTGDAFRGKGVHLDHFYAEVLPQGKKDMAWELSSTGFLMTLSSYVPDLIEADFCPMVERALHSQGLERDSIAHWCIHPGGKKILEAVHKSLGFTNGQLDHGYNVLNKYGNMSSPTILFVLRDMLQQGTLKVDEKVFAAAFGPGLTLETFVATVVE